MKTVFQKTTWMSAGLLLALTCGMPAIADDTELLLINPDESQQIPNVMLIIDSSGSMGNTEETKEVYDYLEPYVGISPLCDPNYLYWTAYKNVTPSCDAANAQRIHKSAFLCDDATKRLQGIGSYRGRMAQHRRATRRTSSSVPRIRASTATASTMASCIHSAAVTWTRLPAPRKTVSTGAPGQRASRSRYTTATT
jgi:hypothetical protein